MSIANKNRREHKRRSKRFHLPLWAWGCLSPFIFMGGCTVLVVGNAIFAPQETRERWKAESEARQTAEEERRTKEKEAQTPVERRDYAAEAELRKRGFTEEEARKMAPAIRQLEALLGN